MSEGIPVARMGRNGAIVKVGDPVHFAGPDGGAWIPDEERPPTHLVAELGPDGVPTRFERLPVEKKKARRGFAAMDRAKVSEIARKGGQSAHVQGKAHVFTSDEARAAGRKGGLATHRKLRAAAGDPSKA